MTDADIFPALATGGGIARAVRAIQKLIADDVLPDFEDRLARDENIVQGSPYTLPKILLPSALDATLQEGHDLVR